MNEFKLRKLLASSFPYWDRQNSVSVWKDRRFFSPDFTMEENIIKYLKYINELEERIFDIFRLVRLDYKNYAKFRESLFRHRRKFVHRTEVVLLLERNYKEGIIL